MEMTSAASTSSATTVTSARTVKEVAIELLCRVVYFENKNKKPSPENRVSETDPLKRSVGMSYDEILEEIRAEFPNCKTSTECLRWYAVKIRAGEEGYENLRMAQRRPRAAIKSKA